MKNLIIILFRFNANFTKFLIEIRFRFESLLTIYL